MERHTRGKDRISPFQVAGDRRTGIPLSKPYAWDRSSDEREAEVRARVAAIRASLHGNDTQPDPYIDTMAAEHQQEYEPEPEPTEPPRCEACGYLLTRCSCPGGPRGGVR